VVNVHQRPKVDDYREQLYVACRMPGPIHGFETRQISLILADGVLITFEEHEGPSLEAVRRRIREGSGHIRGSGVDYLAYALVDAIVDAFFPVLENFERRLVALEDEVMHLPDRETITHVYEAKREILALRRVVWPLRDVAMALMRDHTSLITDVTRVYLRDCYDHAAELAETLQNYHDAASGLLEVCLSLASHRLNEVMKVLTLIATIFIPLTFIAGIYGMNFDRTASSWNMPELGWYLGYPLCLALMAGIAVALLVYFRRLGWIGAASRARASSPTPERS
jgi:magnesium transporter